MNNRGWESGEKMTESVKKEPRGRKILLGLLTVVEAIGAVCVMVLAQILAFNGFAFFGLLLGFDPSVFVEKFDGSSTFFYTLITIPVMYFYIKIIRSCNEPKFMNQKLNSISWVFVVVIAFGLMGLVSVYFVVADQIAQQFTQVADAIEDYSESVDRFAQITPEKIPAFDHILNFIGVCFLVPIAEELTFRAGVLQTLLKRFHPVVSVIMSALIFGALHVQPIHIGYALMAGFFLGWVYFYTRSIRSTILMHMIFNLFGSGLTTFFASGLFGDITDFTNEFNLYSFRLEFALMIPSIICFFFLRAMYKNSVRINTSAKPAEAQGALSDTDPVEDFVPDENAPSPFAPISAIDGEKIDE